MATFSSILVWRIPWTEEPGMLQFVGSQRSGCNWVTNTFTFFPFLTPQKTRPDTLGLFGGNIKTDSSVQFSRSVVSDSATLWTAARQPPCPSSTPRAYSNSCPLSWWCHPTISSSFISFFSCLQSFPASGSFQMSQFFTSGGQSIGISASTSVLPVNIQDQFPLGWTGWISLQSKGLSRVFSHTTAQKRQFSGAQLSL